MDERGRWMAQRSQIDTALGIASRAFDFEPWVGPVHGVVDVGNRLMEPPSAHIRSFQDSQALQMERPA